jgi:hypothetical protein
MSADTLLILFLSFSALGFIVTIVALRKRYALAKQEEWMRSFHVLGNVDSYLIASILIFPSMMVVASIFLSKNFFTTGLPTTIFSIFLVSQIICWWMSIHSLRSLSKIRRKYDRGA